MGPREIVVAVVILAVLCSVLFVLFCIGAYKWTTRPSRRYPVAPRVRPERAEEIDLAKERYEYCSARDSYLEERMLRRVA